jgi:hypothetical protein
VAGRLSCTCRAAWLVPVRRCYPTHSRVVVAQLGYLCSNNLLSLRPISLFQHASDRANLEFVCHRVSPICDVRPPATVRLPPTCHTASLLHRPHPWCHVPCHLAAPPPPCTAHTLGPSFTSSRHCAALVLPHHPCTVLVPGRAARTPLDLLPRPLTSLCLSVSCDQCLSCMCHIASLPCRTTPVRRARTTRPLARAPSCAFHLYSVPLA